MKNLTQKEIKLNHVYLNNAIEVNMVDNKHNKTKHLFKDVWSFQKYLIEKVKDKKIAYQLFSKFMEQYHAYMNDALSHHKSIQHFRPGLWTWPLKKSPFRINNDSGHIILN